MRTVGFIHYLKMKQNIVDLLTLLIISRSFNIKEVSQNSGEQITLKKPPELKNLP